MRSRLFSRTDTHLLTLAVISCLLILLQCRPTSDEIITNREIVQTDTTGLPPFLKERSSILNGSVIIRLEPHGSIRAEVFKNQQVQYEFILDREKQQSFLTRKTIDRANVYIMSRTGLVIDDLIAEKRYILAQSYHPDPLVINRLQRSKYKITLLKGYSSSTTSGGFSGIEE